MGLKHHEEPDHQEPQGQEGS
jgi:hypothetical protein